MSILIFIQNNGLIIQYHFQASLMQIQAQTFCCKAIINHITTSQNVILLTIFINFLDDHQIQTLAMFAIQNQRQDKFYRIVIAKYFMQKYLNRVDRSLFFLFYDDQNFKSIEHANANALAYSLHPYLVDTYHKFQRIFAVISQQTAFLQNNQQLNDILQRLYFEPDLPMPKMKRETIAMYATTPLQQHLALLAFPEDTTNTDQWLQPPLLELKDVIQSEAKPFISLDGDKLETILFKGYLIKPNNWQEYLLKGQDVRAYNLVVLLLALSSQVAETFVTTIGNIEDPMMRFVEFLLRANIYRNIILEVQEKFGFLFRTINTISLSESQLPPFSFIRATLSSWLQAAHPLHQRNGLIYSYVVGKLREGNLLQRLSERADKLPSLYGELKRALEFSTFSDSRKSLAYEENGGGQELQSFFESNIEMYEILAKDYQDYIMDFSINLKTVHWCGHSQQKVSERIQFSQFSNGFVEQSMMFYEFVKNLLFVNAPNEAKIAMLKQLIKLDLQFISDTITSPVILFKVVQKINEMLLVEMLKINEKIDQEKQLISWQFSQKDNLISYFAGKANIQQDCEVHQQFYYNWQLDPNAEPGKNQQLNKSMQSEEEIYEDVYLSDQEK